MLSCPLCLALASKGKDAASALAQAIAEAHSNILYLRVYQTKQGRD